MNCQDITRILDDGDIGHMTERERGEVEVHLSACPDCAADWKIHRRLASGFAPPLPDGLMERARAVVVAGAVGNARRAPSRAILFGTILALAAAAALLGLWLNKPAASTAVVEAPEPAVVATPVDVVSQMQVQAEPAAVRVPQPATPASLPGQVTVRVPAVQVEGDDAAGNVMAQRFRTLVIAKLRAVPGLTVVDPESGGTGTAEYEIRMTFSGTASSTSRMIKVDPQASAAFAATDAVIKAEAKMNPADQQRSRALRQRDDMLRQTASRRQSTNVSLFLGRGFPTSTILDSPAFSRPPTITDEADYNATRLVHDLRTRFLPLDPALESERLATLRDSSQRSVLRSRALADLLSMAERRGGFPAADAAVVRAGGEFALTLVEPRDREMVWEGLALTKHPELVPYLIRGLDEVPQPETRLQIVRILSTVFSDDSRAREALKVASEKNEQQVVRMASERESQDGSRWNEYVVATLNNSSLPDLQRLQPIADMVPNQAALVAGTAKAKIELDDRTIRELGTLIIRAGRDPAATDAAQKSLQVLAIMKSPAARDVIIDVLRTPDNELPGMSKVSLMGLKLKALTASYQSYWGDAKVRAALEDMAASTAPGAMGVEAKAALQTMDTKATLEKITQQQLAQPK